MEFKDVLLAFMTITEVSVAWAAGRGKIEVVDLSVTKLRGHLFAGNARERSSSAFATRSERSLDRVRDAVFDPPHKPNNFSRVRLWVVNFARRNSMSIRLRGQRSKLRYGRMSFADVKKQGDVELSPTDAFIAKDRALLNGKPGRATVAAGIYGSELPEYGDCVVTIAEKATDTGSEIVVYPMLLPRREYPTIPSSFDSHGRPSLTRPAMKDGRVIVVNTMDISTRIDIILLHEEQCRLSNPCLYRVGKNLATSIGVTVHIRPGNYEVKVVETNSTRSPDKFKNTPSLFHQKRIFLYVEANKPTFLILGGTTRSESFPLSFKILPGTAEGTHFDYPAIPFFFFNAYPSTAPLLVSMSRDHGTISLPYGTFSKIPVSAAFNDRYAVEIVSEYKTAPTIIRELVKQDVPFKNGNCLFIANAQAVVSHSGHTDADIFFGCFYNADQAISMNRSWLLSYHALAHYAAAIDVFIARVDEPNNAGLYFNPSKRIYVISGGLTMGVGQTAGVHPGYYAVKVAPKGTINHIKDYRLVESLIQPTCIHIKPNSTYYAVVHGLAGHRGKAPSYTIVSQDGTLANVNWQRCKTVHQLLSSPGPHDSSPSTPQGLISTYQGRYRNADFLCRKRPGDRRKTDRQSSRRHHQSSAPATLPTFRSLHALCIIFFFVFA